MIFTKQDISEVNKIANTQEKKELLVRMFVSAMISGTNITAPEMRACSQQVINTLMVKENKEVVKQNQAV
jgi:hypothetical protein